MINNLSKILEYTESINKNLTNILFIRLLSELPNHNLNPTQTLIIYRIGNLNTHSKIGELINLRCYSGTNISYNLKKLAEKGYIKKYNSSDDMRIFNIGLTQSGIELHAIIKDVFDKEYKNIQNKDLPQLTEDLHLLDDYLTERCFFL